MKVPTVLTLNQRWQYVSKRGRVQDLRMAMFAVAVWAVILVLDETVWAALGWPWKVMAMVFLGADLLSLAGAVRLHRRYWNAQ